MIYLDYAATSLKRKDIIKKLLEDDDILDGNASSTHTLGRKANKHLENARKIIAKSINANPKNIIFTSGASESNNTIIKQFDNADYEIITTNIEHKSILEPLEHIKAKIHYLSADINGLISLEELKEKINSKTKLVSVIYVNNELGSTQEVDKIGAYLEDKDIHFHIDCVQAYGHIDIDVEKIKCDSLSLSGHKIGGLNGLGVLFVNKKIKPMILGGSQENNKRAGTENILSAISMAKCIEDINQEEKEKILDLKKYFIARLRQCEIPFDINGDMDNLVNHIVNIYFPFVKNDLFLTFLDMNGVCASAGSACNAGALEPSYVIKNIYDEDRAKHSIRFSFGFSNTKEEIDKVVEIINKMYQRKKYE